MKNILLETAERFVKSKYKYEFVMFCNNGLKMAVFNKTPNGFMTVSLKEYNPLNKMFGCYVSSSSFCEADILYTINFELDKLPIKPIVLFRSAQKIKLATQ